VVFAALTLLCNGCGGSIEPAGSRPTGIDASAAADGTNGADGPNPGVAKVQGTAGGQTFSSDGAVGILWGPPQMGSPAPSLVALIVAANFVATCNELKDECFQHTAHPNEAVLRVILGTGTTPLRPGAYAVTTSASGDGAAGAVVSASFTATDANCTPTTQESATGGSITVSAVDGSSIAGDFEFNFQSGDLLRGEFSAPYCNWYPNNCGTEVAPPPVTCLH
jgi:hypothetical protein